MLAQILQFSRTLRAAGMSVDPRAAIDLSQGIRHIDLANPADFYAAARALYVYRREDLGCFDEIFRQFWYRQRHVGSSLTDSDSAPPRAVTQRPQFQPDNHTGEESDKDHATYSPDEVIARKDIATLSDSEIERARRLLQDFIRVFAQLRSRRFVADSRRRQLNFRRSLRHAMSSDAELIKLFYRNRKKRKARLLLLCDVSGSMKRYSQFLLEFIFGLRRELPQTEVAVFATHTTVITDLLETRTVGEALQAVTNRARDWGGGTDIGGCLAMFNERYSRELVTAHSVVVLLSDGWDRGDAERMSEEIRLLRSRANKLIWLNPLLGGHDYEPLTRGMRTALPHLDFFLPAHNLESLAQLANTLQSTLR